jgi:hypothetical protein
VAKQQFPQTLQLYRGNSLLGAIDVKPGDGDLPWRSGTFRPSEGFDAVRDLFEQELRLLRANEADDSALWDDWEAVHAELHDPGIRLESKDGSYFADEILIHINGSEAWWRSEDTQ